jgi:hypothetical protein
MSEEPKKFVVNGRSGASDPKGMVAVFDEVTFG